MIEAADGEEPPSVRTAAVRRRRRKPAAAAQPPVARSGNVDARRLERESVCVIEPARRVPTSKLGRVLDMLAADAGATIGELTTATGWLEHTTRAALTGLRHRGYDAEPHAKGARRRFGLPDRLARAKRRRNDRRRARRRTRRRASASRPPMPRRTRRHRAASSLQSRLERLQELDSSGVARGMAAALSIGAAAHQPRSARAGPGVSAAGTRIRRLAEVGAAEPRRVGGRADPDEAGGAPTPKPAPPRLKPGARLVREWHGRTHSVVVLDDAFEFEGKRYRSLTQIAREITGAHWSGPRFFGLAKRSGGAEVGRPRRRVRDDPEETVGLAPSALGTPSIGARQDVAGRGSRTMLAARGHAGKGERPWLSGKGASERGRSATKDASAECAQRPRPLRDLHPQIVRGRARAGVQLPRRPARGLRGLCPQPEARGLDRLCRPSTTIPAIPAATWSGRR